MQFGHHIARCVRRRDDALPDAEIVAWEGFGDSWKLGSERKPLRVHQAENLDLLLAPQRQRHIDALHAERNIAGKDAGDLRGAAAIRNGGEIGPGHHVQQPDIDLRGRRADPDLERARLGLLPIDELLDRVDRDFDIANHRRRDERDHRDWRKIFERVIGELTVEEWIHHQRAVDRHQQGVAVGRRLRDCLGADDGVSPRPIIDDDLLAQLFTHFLADEPTEKISRSAWRKGNYERDLARRVGLRGCNRNKKDETCHGAGKTCFHGFDPFC